MRVRVFRNFVVYSISNYLPKFGNFLLLPFISSYLTTSDFGNYVLALSIIQAFSYLKMLGMDLIISNVYFKHPKLFKPFWNHVYGFLTLASLILGVVFFLILFLVFKSEEYAFLLAILTSIPIIFFSVTEGIYLRLYNAMQKSENFLYRSILFGLVNILTTYYCIVELKLGFMGWFWAALLASFISFLFMIYVLIFKEGIVPYFFIRWKSIMRILRVSLPILPHYYGTYLMSTSDRLQLKFLGQSTTDIGKYGIAAMFSNVAQMISNSFKLSVGPQLTTYLRDHDFISYLKAIRRYQVIFLFLTIFLSVWLNEIISIFFSKQYEVSISDMAIWLVMSINYVPIYMAINQQFFFYEKTKSLWKRSFFAFAVNLLLNIVFVPVFGVVVAAISTFLTNFFFAISGMFMDDFKMICKVKIRAIEWMLLCLFITLFLVYLLPNNPIIKISISIIVALFLIFYFKTTIRNFYNAFFTKS